MQKAVQKNCNCESAIDPTYLIPVTLEVAEPVRSGLVWSCLILATAAVAATTTAATRAAAEEEEDTEDTGEW